MRRPLSCTLTILLTVTCASGTSTVTSQNVHPVTSAFWCTVAWPRVDIWSVLCRL